MESGIDALSNWSPVSYLSQRGQVYGREKAHNSSNEEKVVPGRRGEVKESSLMLIGCNGGYDLLKAVFAF